MKMSFYSLYLDDLINQIEPDLIWFKNFSSTKRNILNETRIFQPKFI
jgi:hypothetical protein